MAPPGRPPCADPRRRAQRARGRRGDDRALRMAAPPPGGGRDRQAPRCTMACSSHSSSWRWRVTSCGGRGRNGRHPFRRAATKYDSSGRTSPAPRSPRSASPWASPMGGGSTRGSRASSRSGSSRWRWGSWRSRAAASSWNGAVAPGLRGVLDMSRLHPRSSGSTPRSSPSGRSGTSCSG